MRVELGIGGCWGLVIEGECLKSSSLALMDDGSKSVLCTCNDGYFSSFFAKKNIYI